MNQRSTGTRWENSTLRGSLRGRDLAHRLDDLGHAQRERGRRAARERRRDDARRRVERDDAASRSSTIAASGRLAIMLRREDPAAAAPVRPHRVTRRARRRARAHAPLQPSRTSVPGRSRSPSTMPAILAQPLSIFGATPSHNSRTPRMMSESANGTT